LDINKILYFSFTFKKGKTMATLVFVQATKLLMVPFRNVGTIDVGESTRCPACRKDENRVPWDPCNHPKDWTLRLGLMTTPNQYGSRQVDLYVPTREEADKLFDLLLYWQAPSMRSRVVRLFVDEHWHFCKTDAN
jgi:hypothetical protein